METDTNASHDDSIFYELADTPDGSIDSSEKPNDINNNMRIPYNVRCPSCNFTIQNKLQGNRCNYNCNICAKMMKGVQLILKCDYCGYHQVNSIKQNKTNNYQSQICPFYQKGNCKNGNKCKKSHQ